MTEHTYSVNFSSVTNILPTVQAETLCKKWMEDLDGSEFGNILKTQNNGKMLGLLVCTDGTIYRAFSGKINGNFEYEGFVKPLFNIKEMQTLIFEADKAVKAETDICKQRAISGKYQQNIRKLYSFRCFDGKTRTLDAIAPNTPTGTGDCCAPKLLNQCYSEGKKPSSMAEFFYGNGTLSHKQFYSPCDERCKPILKHIIGLDVIYLDDDIVVINKPSGILSIEGKTEKDCIAARVRNLYHTINQPCIHRLDQATSGLLVLAINQKAHDILSKQFENRTVYKEYTALVDGLITENSGSVDLPIRPDIENRPYQIVDFENGKQSQTDWEKISVVIYKGRKCTKLLLIPKTGRTHQLRVHCSYGLKHPIVNDSLYGQNKDCEHLLLTATKLEFNHPTTSERLSFQVPFSNPHS